MNIGNKHNSDDVFSRAIVVGLINLLNNKIQYENYLSETDKKDIIEVPWFFNQSGDERFMQDFFQHWDNCIHPKLATGNYDIIPRGVVTLIDETIDTGSMTNRFVRGSRVKEVNGQLQTFSAFLNSIPLNISFDCVIETDTYLDSLKIRQTIIETFYAVQVYHVTYKGVKIPCQVGFPEQVGIDKTFEYSYGDDTKTRLTFDLSLQTFQPVFDKTTERHNANRMNSISVGMDTGSQDFKSITITSPEINDEFYSYQDMRLEWQDTGTILRVNLSYQIDNSGDWKPIENSVINSGSYLWAVPTFQDTYPSAVFSQNSNYPALLKVFVNGLGEIEEIKIIEGGDTYTNELKITIEENKDGITPAQINPIIVGGSIIDVEIISPGLGYTPTEEFTAKFRIENTTDPSIYDEIDNIKLR